MSRPIAISLSPNTEKDDVVLALKTIFSPISWFNFRLTEKLESDFAELFGKKYQAIAVNSGRSALFLILKSMGIGERDEVIIQALTCVAVANSVIWNKAMPVYVDVDDTFNIDPKDLTKKITKNTRAIVIQHSFGVPAQIDKVIEIARKHKLIVIEDCALSLGAKYKNKKIGTFGDYAFFSFGRDKVLSSVFGGIILVNKKEAYQNLLSEQDRLNYPPFTWVVQQLLHPILFSFILPIYNLGYSKFTLGKVLLFLFQKTKILSRAVYGSEKKGRKPDCFPQKMPGALSILALNQLKKLERYNKHRKLIAKYYFDNIKSDKLSLPIGRPESVWTRFPVLVEDKEKIFQKMKSENILLGDWYRKVVVPVNDLKIAKYEMGSCPKAEEYSLKLLNLPTYPTLTKKEAFEVVDELVLCLNSQ